MAKKMDPKLVAGKQRYEVGYFKRKHDLTKEQAVDIIDKAGNSRAKADEMAKAVKK